MDWDKLFRKEYPPPFVPTVSHMYDLRNIDPQFVNEPIPKSVVDDALLSSKFEGCEVEVGELSDRGHTFEGFTFLGGQDEWLQH